MIIIEQKEHQSEDIKNIYLYDEIEEATELFSALSDIENLIYRDSRGTIINSPVLFYDRLLDEIDCGYVETFLIGSIVMENYTLKISYTENVNLTDKVAVGMIYE